MESAAVRFLAGLRFRGLVEVEFKYDSRDRRYKLLDVNPRAWTWIGLSEAAGVDLAWTQWRLSRGNPTPMARAAPGAAWAHVSRDIVAAAQQIFRGTLRPTEYAASFFKPRRFAAFAPDDPLPAIADLPVVISRMIKRRLSSSEGKSAAPRAMTSEATDAHGLLLGAGEVLHESAKTELPPIRARAPRQARL